MASIYKRGKIWWVKWKNYDTGEVVRESLGLRVGFGQDDAKARRLESKYTSRESVDKKSFEGVSATKVGDTEWGKWVHVFIKVRYQNLQTVEKYRVALLSLLYWCQKVGIDVPRKLTREHATEYLVWRTSSKKVDKSDKNYPYGAPKWGKAVRNTALQEISIMGMLLTEAVDRKYIEYNPWLRLGFRKAAVRQKPEITEAEERVIREKLRSAPEWMRVSFNIAMAQGCRLSETRLNLAEQVDMVKERITFKAKRSKVYTVKMNPDLVPMFRSMVKDGREFTMSERCVGVMSCRWRRLFNECGFKHISFHCTRVTAITRAHRAGVSRTLAMTFFNHATDSVHQIYTRLGSDDSDEVVNALRSNCEVEW